MKKLLGGAMIAVGVLFAGAALLTAIMSLTTTSAAYVLVPTAIQLGIGVFFVVRGRQMFRGEDLAALRAASSPGVNRFIGGVQFAVGLLMTGTSGTCVVLLGSEISRTPSSDMSLLAALSMVSLLFLIAGIGAMVIGARNLFGTKG